MNDEAALAFDDGIHNEELRSIVAQLDQLRREHARLREGSVHDRRDGEGVTIGLHRDFERLNLAWHGATIAMSAYESTLRDRAQFQSGAAFADVLACDVEDAVTAFRCLTRETFVSLSATSARLGRNEPTLQPLETNDAIANRVESEVRARGMDAVFETLLSMASLIERLRRTAEIFFQAFEAFQSKNEWSMSVEPAFVDFANASMRCFNVARTGRLMVDMGPVIAATNQAN